MQIVFLDLAAGKANIQQSIPACKAFTCAVSENYCAGTHTSRSVKALGVQTLKSGLPLLLVSDLGLHSLNLAGGWSCAALFFVHAGHVLWNSFQAALAERDFAGGAVEVRSGMQGG